MINLLKNQNKFPPLVLKFYKSNACTITAFLNMYSNFYFSTNHGKKSWWQNERLQGAIGIIGFSLGVYGTYKTVVDTTGDDIREIDDGNKKYHKTERSVEKEFHDDMMHLHKDIRELKTILAKFDDTYKTTILEERIQQLDISNESKARVLEILHQINHQKVDDKTFEHTWEKVIKTEETQQESKHQHIT